jgi:hypothetical protein
VLPSPRRSLRRRREVGAGCTGDGPGSSRSRSPATASSSVLCATVGDRRCTGSSLLRRACRKTVDGATVPAREERCSSGGSVHPYPAVVTAEFLVLRDRIVFSVFSEGCTAGPG